MGNDNFDEGMAVFIAVSLIGFILYLFAKFLSGMSNGILDLLFG